MKKNCSKVISTFLLIIIFISTNSFAQSSFYERLKNIDLALILSPDSIVDDANEKFKRPEILGYIDTNFQRFRIHFTSIEKSNQNPYVYNVSGKTKVKENICSFTGTINVSSAVFDTSDQIKELGFPNYRQGRITSKIHLEEDKSQNGSGIFKGELTTDIFFDDKGVIHYDAIMLIADGYSNNQFRGTWTSYKTNKTKVCNWGGISVFLTAEILTLAQVNLV